MKKTDVPIRHVAYALLMAASVLLLLLMGLIQLHQREAIHYSSHAPSVQVTLLPPTAQNWLPNAGSATQLDELPGIGATIAARIIAERDAHGPFFFPEDLMSVKGVGKKTLAGIMAWLEANPDKAFVPPEE